MKERKKQSILFSYLNSHSFVQNESHVFVAKQRMCATFILTILLFGNICKSIQQEEPVVVKSPIVIYQNVTNGSIFDNVDRRCDDNEIYIVDGERTLVITNNKMARDIDHIQVRMAKKRSKLVIIFRCDTKKEISIMFRYGNNHQSI